MKVLVINNLYAPIVRGGAERSVQLLAEALVRDGVEVTVICCDARARATVELNGVKVVTMAVPNVHWPFGERKASWPQRRLWHLIDVCNPRARREVLSVIESEQPDIVHTNNLQGLSVSVWSAAAAAGIPVLHTLRDYYLICARANRFRRGRICGATCLSCLPFLSMRRAVSQRVAGVVGTSRFILDAHLDLGCFRQAQVRCVIGNICTGSGGVCRRAGGRDLVFGYLGRLDPVKGIEVLLAAFEGRSDPGWQLHIAGTGEARFVQALQARARHARQPERICFVGWADAAEFLSHVDVLIVPSRWDEPWSRVAAEAQVHGAPVLAAHRGGLPDVVEEDVTGLFFEPENAGDLSAAVDRLLSDSSLLARLSAAAVESADRFRPEAVARAYCQVYSQIVDSSAPRAGSGGCAS